MVSVVKNAESDLRFLAIFSLTDLDQLDERTTNFRCWSGRPIPVISVLRVQLPGPPPLSFHPSAQKLDLMFVTQGRRQIDNVECPEDSLQL